MLTTDQIVIIREAEIASSRSPIRRPFFNPWHADRGHTAVLMLSALTWYDTSWGRSAVRMAQVILNGSRLGYIQPFPWLIHDEMNFGVQTFTFSPRALFVRLPGARLPILEIIPYNDANSVMVQNVVLLYKQNIGA